MLRRMQRGIKCGAEAATSNSHPLWRYHLDADSKNMQLALTGPRFQLCVGYRLDRFLLEGVTLLLYKPPYCIAL